MKQDPVRRSPIADAIDRYRRDCQAQERGRVKREVSTIVFSALAAAAAGLSAWYFQGQLRAMRTANDDNRKAIVAANRAWISPITARLASAINTSADIIFEVHYQNTGKEPALRFAGPPDGEELNWVERPKQGQTWFDVFSKNAIRTNMCDTTVADTAIAVYPTVPIKTYSIRMHNEHLTKEMIDGEHPFFLHGCFAYHSPVDGNKKEWSEYCFLFLKAGNDEVPIACPYGDNAQ